jgi:anti-sigma B factor antagonist
MSDIKISLDSSGPAGELSIVRVDGVIDTMTSTDLEKVMNSLMERRRYNIIIDLGGVDYISSAGWGIFISNIREIRQHSGDIKLARMIPNVYEIFELLEFDSILKAFDSVEKARIDFDGMKKGSPEEIVPAEKPVAAATPETDPGHPGEKPALASVPSASEATVIIDAGKPPPEEIRPVDIVIEMISKDPFLSISEIKREISKKHPALKVGWWNVWGILRREKLLSKKNRFHRARSKSGGN